MLLHVRVLFPQLFHLLTVLLARIFLLQMLLGCV